MKLLSKLFATLFVVLPFVAITACSSSVPEDDDTAILAATAANYMEGAWTAENIKIGDETGTLQLEFEGNEVTYQFNGGEKETVPVTYGAAARAATANSYTATFSINGHIITIKHTGSSAADLTVDSESYTISTLITEKFDHPAAETFAGKTYTYQDYLPFTFDSTGKAGTVTYSSKKSYDFTYNPETGALYMNIGTVESDEGEQLTTFYAYTVDNKNYLMGTGYIRTSGEGLTSTFSAKTSQSITEKGYTATVTAEYATTLKDDNSFEHTQYIAASIAGYGVLSESKVRFTGTYTVDDNSFVTMTGKYAILDSDGNEKNSTETTGLQFYNGKYLYASGEFKTN